MLKIFLKDNLLAFLTGIHVGENFLESSRVVNQKFINLMRILRKEMLL